MTPITVICVLSAVVASDSSTSSVLELHQWSTTTHDTLAPGGDESQDAKVCLEGLCWKPTSFPIRCTEPVTAETGDVLVRFPSPVPVGDELNDLVAMEWYVAKDADGNAVNAPAVVVIHESGSSMPVGRLFARGLRQRGLHTFMMQLPYYGERRQGRSRPRDARILKAFEQGIADTRRARDVVAAVPYVDKSNISLQGTSLGGFISATTAGLDRAYDHVFIMLAGGNVYGVLQNGQRDAAKVREKLEQAGLSDADIRALAVAVEPNRLAHRVDSATTWLYSATEDTVVPLENAMSFAAAAGLDHQHHIRMYANHYTGVIYVPVVLDQIRDLIVKGRTTAP